MLSEHIAHTAAILKQPMRESIELLNYVEQLRRDWPLGSEHLAHRHAWKVRTQTIRGTLELNVQRGTLIAHIYIFYFGNIYICIYKLPSNVARVNHLSQI